ncbi:MAG: ATP-binding protein [Gemmatimonadota bacterium]
MTRRVVAVAIAFAFAGLLISFLVYTSQLAGELRRDAAAFSRIYFQVVNSAASPEGWTAEAEFALLGELYALQVPVVLTDTAGTPNQQPANLPFDADFADPDGARRIGEYAATLDLRNPPIVVPDADVVIHYGEPLFLRRLKWIPWLQAALLLGVAGTGVWVIRTGFRGERERIWSAMARESAHQMGTPLSSLVGWLEHLDAAPREAEGEGAAVSAATTLPVRSEPRPDRPSGETGAVGEERGERLDATSRAAGRGTRVTVDSLVLEEMATDVGRLHKVSRRFELIGRPPELGPVDVGEIVTRLGRYFATRLPTLGSRTRLDLAIEPGEIRVLGNETLLEWAFENLVKNAIDALAGQEGWIRVSSLGVIGERAVYRVADSGPGVPPAIRDRIFDLGVSTKEGGWGVGLSLTRRIIRNMHHGAIMLESSDSGTSFRIELPVAEEEA